MSFFCLPDNYITEDMEKVILVRKTSHQKEVRIHSHGGTFIDEISHTNYHSKFYV